jgi:hypothetical protein
MTRSLACVTAVLMLFPVLFHAVVPVRAQTRAALKGSHAIDGVLAGGGVQVAQMAQAEAGGGTRADTTEAEDRKSADRMRTLAMQALNNPRLGKLYRAESDPDKRAIYFAFAMGEQLLVDMDYMPTNEGTAWKGPGFWRSLLLTVGSPFVPGALDIMLIRGATRTPAGVDLRVLNVELADQRAKAVARVAQVLVREYVGAAEAAAFPTDPRKTRVQNLLRALRARQDKMSWPSLGILYLTDVPNIDTKVMPYGFGPRGSAGKDVVGLHLGKDSPEYQSWDDEKSERHRGEIVQKALARLFERGLMVLSDPPELDADTFKDQVQLVKTLFGDSSHDRIVAEAFGKDALDRFRELTRESQQEENGRTMDPNRRRELTDLYSAAVVLAATQQYLFYLSL